MKQILVCGLLLAGLTGQASAFDYIAGYKDWAVYKDTVNGEAVCYATTPAEDKAPKSVQHGDVHFFVTYFRSSRLPQNSMRVSFGMREDVPAKTIISGRSWSMYAAGNEVFAGNDDERAITEAARKGSDLKVEATSARNTEVAYSFSLSGSSSAIDKAKALCS